MLKLEIGPLIVDRLIDLRPEEAVVRGVTEILGVPHHVYFVEVTKVEDEDYGAEQVSVNDPYGRLGDIQRLNEGRLLTVKVPGYQGDYLTVIFPFAD